jgi:uncharacterized protein (TIGR02596 family)
MEHRVKHNAFSMVELMTVLAIISVLLAMAVPSIDSLMRATDLTASGESVYGVLHTARQAARAKNAPVEVRFYRESVGSPVATVEAYAQRDDGTYQRIAEHAFEEGKGIVTLKPEMTTLLRGEIHEDPGSQHPEPKTYQFFRFRPDGSTELDETQKWFLTLLYDEESEANYYTIQVNPFSGNLKTYRP